MSQKPEPHVFVVDHFMPWAYCINCGLITLRNPLSQLSIKLGCADHSKNPKYQAELRRLDPFR